MKKPQVIDASTMHECYTCSGDQAKNRPHCPTCKGTGLYKEEFFHLVVEDPSTGQLIAFGIDQAGK